MEATRQIGLPPRRVRIAENGSAFVGLAAAIALTILRTVNSEPYDRAVLPSAALAAAVATPGLLALLARRRRPSLYLASGFAYLPMSFLSMAGVMLPLLLVAAMAFVAYGRHADEETPLVWAPLSAMVLFIHTIAIFAVLLFLGTDDERCATTATSMSCTSDVITNGEALAGFGLVALTLAVAWLLARPKRQKRII